MPNSPLDNLRVEKRYAYGTPTSSIGFCTCHMQKGPGVHIDLLNGILLGPLYKGVGHHDSTLMRSPMRPRHYSGRPPCHTPKLFWGWGGMGGNVSNDTNFGFECEAAPPATW